MNTKNEYYYGQAKYAKLPFCDQHKALEYIHVTFFYENLCFYGDIKELKKNLFLLGGESFAPF